MGREAIRLVCIWRFGSKRHGSDMEFWQGDISRIHDGFSPKKEIQDLTDLGYY
ncbi:hypothetical protein YC2023_082465 [Brassica napus]